MKKMKKIPASNERQSSRDSPLLREVGGDIVIEIVGVHTNTIV